ncbi:MAG: YceI family protein [Cyclobacteriaceae bacterium]|nr:YceI family protein [Cyclobacteriaceae bacterium]
MKTFKLIPILTLLFVLVFAVRCSDDSSSTPTPLFGISGKVTYPDAGGAATAANGAVVTLSSSSPSVSMEAIADASGNYKFSNLEAATYTLSAIYDTDNKNNSARLDGLRFTVEDVEVVVSTAAVTQNLALTSPGQVATPAIVANYTWDEAQEKYVQPAAPAWQFDNNHSLVTFEFPYRSAQADFIGSFKQMHKFVVDFDPADLAGSSIDVEVDMASVDTRTPGGRDNLPEIADNPVFSPSTVFTKLGCIAGDIIESGITTDAGGLLVNANRYAKFSSTDITKYGDGYLAKGNLIFHGSTKAIELWFKALPPFDSTNSNGTVTTRTGFEGRFMMDAKNDFGVTSSSVNGADVTITISVVGSVTE